jgi:hypothetical protein
MYCQSCEVQGDKLVALVVDRIISCDREELYQSNNGKVIDNLSLHFISSHFTSLHHSLGLL